MIRTLLVLWVCLSSLSAQQLNELIAAALQQHPSLQSIEARMNGVDEAIAVAGLFHNPKLSIGMSDIQLANPLKRSLEPMQTTSVGITQSIPYFGKRKALQELKKAQKKVLYHSLRAAEVALVKEIKLSAYAIWEREEHLNIVEDLLKTLQQSMELQAVYSRTDETAHMQMMIAELGLSQLKIKQSRLHYEREGLYARLRYLANTEIDTLHLSLHVNQPIPQDLYEAKLTDNRELQIQNARLREAHDGVRVAKLSRKSDVAVGITYHYREAFRDYVNVNVGISLPIYSRETHDIQASRQKVLERSLMRTDWHEQIHAQLQRYYAQLQNAYTVEHIITDETLPQIEHMLELADTAIRNGADMSDYLELIERKLALDEQRIAAIARYYSAQASIDALIGEVK